MQAPMPFETALRGLLPAKLGKYVLPDLRRDPTKNPPAELSYVSCLPPELLAFIFHSLVHSIYNKAFRYRVDYPTFLYCHDFVSEVDPDITSLVAATQVCRYWCMVGSVLLYNRPFLISNYHIRKFSATLQEAPALATLVRHVVVLDQSAYLPKTIYQKVKNAQEERLARTALTLVLSLSTSLESLTITNRGRLKSAILPVDDAFCRNCCITNRLRKLTIYGVPFAAWRQQHSFLSSDVSLPNLQILCLRQVFLCHGFIFPPFPNFRTLQLTQCSLYTNGALELNAKSFPMLHTLQLYENRLSVTISQELMRQIRDYHYISYTNSDSYTYPLSPSSLSPALCHLATLFIDIAGKPLTSHLPRTLQRLTLIWSWDNIEKAMETFTQVMGELCVYLSRKDVGLLQTITILQEPGMGLTEGLERFIAGLRMACQMHDVELDMSCVCLGEWIAGASASPWNFWDSQTRLLEGVH